jgi:hypothetical protein
MANTGRFAMTAAILLRDDFDGPALRRLARQSRDVGQTRRLLALAAIYDGGSRSDAARTGGVGVKIVRDWVVRFNAKRLSRPRSAASTRRATIGATAPIRFSTSASMSARSSRRSSSARFAPDSTRLVPRLFRPRKALFQENCGRVLSRPQSCRSFRIVRRR